MWLLLMNCSMADDIAFSIDYNWGFSDSPLSSILIVLRHFFISSPSFFYVAVIIILEKLKIRILFAMLSFTFPPLISKTESLIGTTSFCSRIISLMTNPDCIFHAPVATSIPFVLVQLSKFPVPSLLLSNNSGCDPLSSSIVEFTICWFFLGRTYTFQISSEQML